MLDSFLAFSPNLSITYCNSLELLCSVFHMDHYWSLKLVPIPTLTTHLVHVERSILQCRADVSTTCLDTLLVHHCTFMRRITLASLSLGCSFRQDFLFPDFYYKNVHRDKLKEFYNEHSHILCLYYIINILLYLLDHITIHLSIPLHIYQFILHFHVLKTSFKYQYIIPHKCMSLTWVHYLFTGLFLLC
jgi:hypothetical protein